MAAKLEPRKEMILAAVVEEYVRSAQPVGSKTVVRQGVKASSATVRNEMAELEEMGFLEQPHTSAGRVPADLGLRYYVDHLQGGGLGEDDREQLQNLGRSFANVSDLIGRTVGLLAELSKQVGVVMVASLETMPLAGMHFREAGPSHIRVILRFADGSQEERLIRNERALDGNGLLRLSNLINKIAPGRTMIGLRRELLRQMEEMRNDLYLARALELSEQVVNSTLPEVFIRGQDHLFDVPEFLESGRIRDMVRTLEEKSVLARLLEQATIAGATRVIIGAENNLPNMRHCAVIARSWGGESDRMGTLGVIGPKRLDYARIIPLVHYTSELISECLRLG